MKRKSIVSASATSAHVAPSQETVSLEYIALVFCISFLGMILLIGWLVIPTLFGYYSSIDFQQLSIDTFKCLLMLEPYQEWPWVEWFQENVNSQIFSVTIGGLIISLMFAFWLSIKAGKQSYGNDLLQVSGAELLEGKSAIRVLRELFKKEWKFSSKGVSVFPDLPLPSNREKQGALIIGQVGSGKTQILLPMLNQVVKAKSKAVTFDIKGDFSSYFLDYDHVALLAPWDSRSIRWAISKDVKTEYQAELFAEALIAENTNDPMWSNSARTILAGCIVVLLSQKGQSWGWLSLSSLLNESSEKLQRFLSKNYPQAAKLVDPQSKTSQSMMLTLHSQVKVIHQLAKAWGEALDGVSLSEWVKSDQPEIQHIIIQNHTDFSALSKSLADLSLYFISQTLLGLPDNSKRSLYFFLDEVAHLRFSQLPTLLSLGRSKGAKLFLGIQDLGLLNRYFSREEIQAISSMLGTLIVLRVSGVGDTLASLSTALGTKEVERLSSTFDYRGNNSYSWQRQELPVVTEAEISQLPQASEKGIVGYLSIAGSNVVAKLNWPLCSIKNQSPAIVWAEWVSGVITEKSVPSRLKKLDQKLTSEFEGGDNAEH